MTTQLHINQTSNPGKWLLRVRTVWFGLIVILFFTFLMSIPAAYTMLTTVCGDSHGLCYSWAQPTTSRLDVLTELNIPLSAFAMFNLFVYVAFSVFCWFAGLLVLRHRSIDWHGLLVSYLLITLAAGGPSLIFASASNYINVPHVVVVAIGLILLPIYLALSLFFQTFPDGRIYPRWAVAGIALILANYTAWLAPEPLNIEFWSPLASGLWLLLVFGFHIFIQGYRYRYHYSVTQRQQTKWLVLGASVTLVTAIAAQVFVDPEYSFLVESLLVAVGFYLPIAVGITIAILRHNLWDIDIIINRTLVYGVLTALLIGVYALIVSTLSLLIQDEGGFVVSLLGAGTIAVIFQPLREVLQSTINRLMFGKRDQPMLVISEMGKSLEAMLSPGAALNHLVETTASTLKLPYVALADGDNQILASYGKGSIESERFPLTYHAQVVGTLLVAPRSPHESFNAVDRLLLENVARQASNMVYASRLTDDLQRSRQQILTTREEERRRLRRDLHDGLGPALATLTLQAEAAKEWLGTNPAKSESLLAEIIKGTQTTLADIRRIVYDLRPPALDDLGLVSAIKEQANHYTDGGLAIRVDAPENLPSLPAAVEVATYRIVQEALTNVAHHAQARTCQVRLSLNGSLDIEIADDGVGISSTHRAGVGLNSMYERAAELGGSCRIVSRPHEGTQIRVSLPRL